MFVFLSILVAATVFISTGKVCGATITVDDSGGRDYMTIQAAVNASSPGDTIYVYNGTYNGSIPINKTINLVGESNQSTIIKGTGALYSEGIRVTINYVNISNIRIDNFYAAIYFWRTNNNSIVANTLTNCNYGIHYSNSNNIISNTIMNCRDCGIMVIDGSYNNITSNTIGNCSQGIYLGSSNNNITSNTVANCSHGIYLYYGSNNNTIVSNNIYGNKGYGLYSDGDTGNTAYNNWWGSVSGPYNAVSNPSGTGDNITDGVPFSPWATSLISTSIPTTNQTTNHAPTITSTSANQTTVNAGWQVTISTVASDIDGDTLTYSYSATGGTITGSSANVVWTAPTTNGTYTITVTVSDGKLTTTGTVNIAVVGGTPAPAEKKENKGFTPGLEAAALLASLGLSALIVSGRERKR